MGMSASQARLIQLEARQSNLEYQGQQINQVRTILSQQGTDLYNSLLNMTVPTPPSTQDYTTIEYKGIDKASNFTLGKIVPTGDTYSVDFNYKQVGNCMEATKSIAPISSEDDTMYLNATDLSGAGVKANEDVPAYEYMVYDISAANVTEESLDNVLKDFSKANDSSVIMKKSNVDLSNLAENNLNGSYFVYDPEEAQFVELNAYNKDEYKGKNLSVYEKVNYADLPKTDDGKLDSDALTDYYHLNASPSFAESKEDVAAKISYAKEDILKANLYVIAGTDGVLINQSNFDSYFEESGSGYNLKPGVEIYAKNTMDTSGTKVKNPEWKAGDEAKYYVNGNLCYSFADALKNGVMNAASKASYIDAIKRSFPEQCAGKTDSQIEDMFYIFAQKDPETGSISTKFALKEDVQAYNGGLGEQKFATIYENNPTGSYTQSVSKDNCTLKFDSSGRIIAISVPIEGTDQYRTIELEATKVTDDVAYQEAMAKYEYAQYEYDKKQQEINAKTEIIQQEDRNLQLKLQRLDNERQQITIEIDAVKKVIQDNIDASYKTFSG